MFASNNLLVVVVGVIVTMVSLEVTLVVAQPNIIKNNAARLQEIQEELLDVVGNSTVSAKNVADLMVLFHSQKGKYMGSLLLEGIILGAARKDTWGLLANFWTQLQGRLSPELQGKLKDFEEFFGGFDVRTLPLILEQLFKKDMLGNRLVDMPLGQLVDMVQPTASKYGVDIKAFMNSVMGKGANNARDLIFSALGSVNVTALLSQFLKNTSSNELKVADAESATAGGKLENEEKARKARKESLWLFRPLVATFMRENKIDLDPDAVLLVLSPMFTPEVLFQVVPLLSTLVSQAGVLKGGEMAYRRKMGEFIERLDALFEGPNQNVDVSTLIAMASTLMFSDGTKRNRDEAKASILTKDRGPEKSMLTGLEGKLTEHNFDNFILSTASSHFAQNARSPQKSAQESKETVISEVQEDSGGVNRKANSNEAEEDSTPPKGVYRHRQITDLIEPVLLAMQTDKLRNRKINDLLLLSTTFIYGNLADLGRKFDEISSLPGVPMFQNDEFFTQIKRPELIYALLNEEEARRSLSKTIAPSVSKMINILPRNMKERVYEFAAIKIDELLLPYGIHGITFDTLPELVAPMVEQVTNAHKLPINPATFLVQLRDYIEDLTEWVFAGLTYMHDQSGRKLDRVVSKSLKKVGDRIAGVVEETREAKPACLPLIICRLNTGLNPTMLATAVTRAASLYFATKPALEDPDPSLLLKVVQAASGKVENCEQEFGNVAECKDLSYTATDKESDYVTHYHDEL